MKLASATIDDVQHEWQKRFAASVAQRAGGRIALEIHPAGALATISKTIVGVLDGRIESFITPTSFLIATAPKFAVFDAPGLFDGPEHLARTIHNRDYRDHIEEIALDRGLRVIGAVVNSPVVILSKTPVECLADLKGLRVRTFDSPLQTEPMKALGASPAPMALAKAGAALRDGRIDAMLAGIPVLDAFGYGDLARHVTELHFAQIVSVCVANEAWFRSLPKDLGRIVRDEGRRAEEAVFGWGVENIDRANRAWRAKGGEIHSLPEAEHRRMMTQFQESATGILNRDPATAAEYQRLLAVACAAR